MAQRGRFTFDQATINDIRTRWIHGEKKCDIARELGINRSTVTKYTAGISRDLLPPSENGELWRVIPGYGGRYFVSNHGRLYSTGAHGGREGLIKDADHGDGYRFVVFSWEGETHAVFVHRLVADAFCDGHSEDRDFVNHIDGNRSNNHANNLEWVNRSENMLHSVHVLGHKTPKGIKAHNRKLTDDQVRAIRNDARSRDVIAIDYGVGHTTVSNIRAGRYYKDVV